MNIPSKNLFPKKKKNPIAYDKQQQKKNKPVYILTWHFLV